MAMKEALNGTPAWFKRLVMPMAFAVSLAVPATLYAANQSNRLAFIELGMIEIQKTVDALERKDDVMQETVHRFEVKLAVVDEKLAVVDGKLDRILNLIEGQ